MQQRSEVEVVELLIAESQCPPDSVRIPGDSVPMPGVMLEMRVER